MTALPDLPKAWLAAQNLQMTDIVKITTKTRRISPNDNTPAATFAIAVGQTLPTLCPPLTAFDKIAHL
jgi:hypothetical protein